MDIQCYVVHSHRYNSTNIAYVMRDLDCAFSNALLRLGTPEMILKPEQQSVVVKFVCGCLLTEVPLLLDASVCFDRMSEKCVTDGSVVVVILPSSCSFLLMVVEVINK